ncbi:MAG: glycoside hydrolase domain-containing protein [Terracidiphilus sp.]|jgi:hypothetical protein
MAQRSGERDPAQHRQYLGFDRNDYPGDAALPVLRKSFRYTGYWLNAPPGEAKSSWTGKREILRRHGFGFLLLFNGRSFAELKASKQNGSDLAALGAADGKAAVAAAEREGFPRDVLIFLDQEEGGRLLPEQATYLFAWADAVREAGARAGVYCSGIAVAEGNGTISTAEDIAERESAGAAENPSAKEKHAVRLPLWIANDQCPPSPGCTPKAPPFAAAAPPAIAEFVSVWQYAQSPRRKQFSAACPANQAADGRCYAPELQPGEDSFVDLNVATSPDPSEAPEE